jgi:hypothetical protein
MNKKFYNIGTRPEIEFGSHKSELNLRKQLHAEHQARQNSESETDAGLQNQKPQFYSIRLDKVLDPGSRFLGPAIELPEILKSIWSKLG